MHRKLILGNNVTIAYYFGDLFINISKTMKPEDSALHGSGQKKSAMTEIV